MKKSNIILLSIIALLFLLITQGFQLFGWIGEKKLQYSCPESSEPSEDCLTRLRAMGHYWTSFGFLTDIKELRHAQYWYSRAANKGDKVAMFHLAWVYEQLASESAPVKTFAQVSNDLKNNVTSAPDKLSDAAIEWYKKSAEKGFAPAMNNIAVIYKHRANDEKYYRDLSYKWHLAAANAGNPMATIAMYTIFKAGDGVEKNEFYADNWKYWDPKRADPLDLSSPTLERTFLPEMWPEIGIVAQVIQATKSGKPVILWKDDNKLPVKPGFEHITKQLNEESSQ